MINQYLYNVYNHKKKRNCWSTRWFKSPLNGLAYRQFKTLLDGLMNINILCGFDNNEYHMWSW